MLNHSGAGKWPSSSKAWRPNSRTAGTVRQLRTAARRDDYGPALPTLAQSRRHRDGTGRQDHQLTAAACGNVAAGELLWRSGQWPDEGIRSVAVRVHGDTDLMPAVQDRTNAVGNPVRRVLLVGDAHGDLEFLERACQFAVANRCHAVLQLGDLGIHWPSATDFAKGLDKVIARFGLRFCFIDGNHEGWHVLNERRRSARRSEDGFIRATRRTEWIDRGIRWRWNGVTFGALGGALSVDHPRRAAGNNWWPHFEQPDDEAVNRLVNGGPLDVLVTHDTLPDVPLRGITLAPDIEAAALDTRQRIARVAEKCRPALLVHGHWHKRYSHHLDIPVCDGDPHRMRIEGLGANIGAFTRAVAVLDLASSTITLPAGPALSD